MVPSPSPNHKAVPYFIQQVLCSLAWALIRILAIQSSTSCDFNITSGSSGKNVASIKPFDNLTSDQFIRELLARRCYEFGEQVLKIV